MIFNVKETDPRQLYKLLIGSVLPRPIAWVSTISNAGKTNLAPFSFFNAVSANPPMVCFSPAYSQTRQGEHGMEVVPKDTLRNVRETEEFVVNIVSQFLAEKMNQTSGDYPSEVSEFEAAGLTPMPSQMVKPPYVGESLINMECKLFKIVEFGHKPGAGSLIIGEVVVVHVSDSVLKDGHIDPDVLQPIGRMGGDFYSTVKDRFEIHRPVIK
jgi:flavin reductase (DIM6/NTAB) family NADH-FMN oxidoreductase RutF